MSSFNVLVKRLRGWAQWLKHVMPATQKAEMRGEIMVQGWPRQKVSKTSSQQISQMMVVWAYNSSYSGGMGGRP
jgi:hypothetical protein